MLRVGFIGVGNVATVLGRYISYRTGQSCNYYSRSYEHGVMGNVRSDVQAGIKENGYEKSLFKSKNLLIDESDLIFISTPDRAISEIAKEISESRDDMKDKVVAHLSGSLSSEELKSLESLGASTCSIHPLFPFSNKKIEPKELKNVYFTVEIGQDNGRARALTKKLFSQLKNPYEEISKEKKTIYHAAAVFMSNLVVGAVNAGMDLYSMAGLTDDFSENAWKPLFKANAEAILSLGTKAALTGPIERGDLATVEKHLVSLKSLQNGDVRGTVAEKDLSELTLKIYEYLSKSVLAVAREKHVDRETLYKEIEKALG